MEIVICSNISLLSRLPINCMYGVMLKQVRHELVEMSSHFQGPV